MAGPAPAASPRRPPPPAAPPTHPPPHSPPGLEPPPPPPPRPRSPPGVRLPHPHLHLLIGQPRPALSNSGRPRALVQNDDGSGPAHGRGERGTDEPTA